MSFKPSAFQTAIFNFVEDPNGGHGVVNAVAGSGKTKTATEAVHRIPSNQTVLFLAFNKAIAEKLQEKMPGHCEARTLNSLGHRAWMRACGSARVRLDADKTRGVMQECMSERDLKFCGPQVRRLVTLAKSHGIVPAGVRGAQGLLPDTTEIWETLLAHYDVDLAPCTLQPQGNETWEDARKEALAHVLGHARRVLTLSCERKTIIDFDDQLYLPVIFGASPPRYDWVIVDEAQDLSAIQHVLVKAALGKRGRLLAIGDTNQAIYGFRGADSNSMGRLREEMGARALPLSICYRCPRTHIELAKAIVPQIEAAPGAETGYFTDLGRDRWSHDTFLPDDLIICRASAPLVRVAFKLLAQRVPVRILGRELGQALTGLIKKLKARDQDDLAQKLDAWRDREIIKLLEKDPEANTDKIDDRHECITVFMDMFPEAGIAGLMAEIEAIYSDNTRGILTLCTVHKAKGLEAERVFIVNEWMLRPGKRAKQEWQVQQELNLRYVALTRATKMLAFIEMPRRGDEKKGGRFTGPEQAQSVPRGEVTWDEAAAALAAGDDQP